MSDQGIPRTSEPNRGERIEEDRPTLDQPQDESAVDDDEELVIDPDDPPPARVVRPS